MDVPLNNGNLPIETILVTYEDSNKESAIDTYSDSGSKSPTSLEATAGKWTHSMIVNLIQYIKEDYDNYKTAFQRGHVYTKIVRKFKENGCTITKDEISKKWANLLTTYRRVRDRGIKTGSFRCTWPYFELLDDILGKNYEKHPPRASALAKRPDERPTNPVKRQKIDVNSLNTPADYMEQGISLLQEIKYSLEETNEQIANLAVQINERIDAQTAAIHQVADAILFLKK